jgi:Sec-independent protein translocase protein TatA
MGIGTNITNGVKAAGAAVIGLGALPQVTALATAAKIGWLAKATAAVSTTAFSWLPGVVGPSNVIFGTAITTKVGGATTLLGKGWLLHAATGLSTTTTMATIIAPILVIAAAAAAIWGISKLCNMAGKAIDQNIEAKKAASEAQERQRQQEQSRGQGTSQSQEHSGHSQPDMAPSTESSRLPPDIAGAYHTADDGPADGRGETDWQDSLNKGASAGRSK